MSDLDDEELEATRKLNGVAKKSNIERTDINVGNIEKDIKRCDQLIKPEHANWIGISNQLAIAHVVDRVKELEEENKILKGNGFRRGLYEKDAGFIEKKKVKEGLESIEDYFYRLNGPDEDIEYIRKIKTELLEGEQTI